MLALYICLGLLLVYLLFSIFAALFVVFSLTKPKFGTREDRKKQNAQKGFLVGTEDFKREQTTFKMSDGYVINGDISMNNPKKFIVFAHGHGSTREGSIRYARIFYPLGYSIVLYDHRGHGDNVRTYPTMGKRESRDMAEIVRQLKERYGADIEVGLFGVSMGGATTCLASKLLNNEIKFAIVDCGYASLRHLVSGICKTNYIPKYPFIWLVNLFLTVFYKFSYGDIVCYSEDPEYNVPMCFIHGDKDKIVLLENSTLLYNKTKSETKKLQIFENAGHSKCVEMYFDSYKETIKSFIESVGE